MKKNIVNYKDLKELMQPDYNEPESLAEEIAEIYLRSKDSRMFKALLRTMDYICAFKFTNECMGELLMDEVKNIITKDTSESKLILSAKEKILKAKRILF